MSFVRVILLGSYISGAVALLLGTLIRVGMPFLGASPRGALSFAAVCFLFTLATREIAAVLAAPKPEAKAKGAAA